MVVPKNVVLKFFCHSIIKILPLKINTDWLSTSRIKYSMKLSVYFEKKLCMGYFYIHPKMMYGI